MEASDKYRSIEAPSTGTYKDNGSKFLAFAYPVTSVEQAMEHVQALKKEYFDARHHCYAYRIGHAGDIWRANDDGEPSSSAGKPILGQILSNELSDIVVVVVRYFGGVKLGIPGLIKAYRTSTADALSAATVIEKVATSPITLEFGYESMNEVMKIIKNFSLAARNQRFDSICSITVDVPLNQVEKFENSFLTLPVRKV